MTLPNFLGIGAMRCGTSWLDVQLRSHSDIYLPARRKEVHFFDEYFDRGFGWYERFFPSPSQARRYSAIGEITPKYLYDENAAARIRAAVPDCKLIAILRNPIDRAYSQYGLGIKKFGETRSFEEFFRSKDEATGKSLYFRQFLRYFERFPRDQILVLIFENSVAADQATALRQIAEFLDIDPNGFSGTNQSASVASSYQSRYPRASAVAARMGRFLRDRDQDWIINAAKRMGVPKLFGNGGAIPPLDPDLRTRLYCERFAADVEAMEDLIGEDLSVWKQSIALDHDWVAA